MPFCDKATAPEQDGPNRPKGGAVFAGQPSLPSPFFPFCCFLHECDAGALQAGGLSFDLLARAAVARDRTWPPAPVAKAKRRSSPAQRDACGAAAARRHRSRLPPQRGAPFGCH